MNDCLILKDSIEILRNIIYSGVWTKFEIAERTEEKAVRKNEMDEAYTILGVSQDATDEEIKKHTGG